MDVVAAMTLGYQLNPIVGSGRSGFGTVVRIVARIGGKRADFVMKIVDFGAAFVMKMVDFESFGSRRVGCHVHSPGIGN